MTREEEVVEYSKPKPNGGYSFIRCYELLALWGCYRDGDLKLLDIRVWMALRELWMTRAQVGAKVQRRFQIDELTHLTRRDAAAVRASLARLESLGLAQIRKRGIAFSCGEPFRATLSRATVVKMIDSTTNHRRKIPMPRRMLRRLSISRSPAFIATVLGQAMRCLYFRDGACRPIGACKSSWIADVFGVHLRNIKRARSRLVEIGWLQPLSADDWYRRAYGWRGYVNLEWRDEVKPPPIARARPPKSPPLYINKNLSTRDNKNLPSGRKVGACAQPENSCPRKAPLGRIHDSELQCPDGIERLFRLAAKAGFVQRSVSGRERIAAAAAHAKRVGTRNSAGLFVWLVKNAKWEYLTSGDEDAVRATFVNRDRKGKRPTLTRAVNELLKIPILEASGVQLAKPLAIPTDT